MTTTVSESSEFELGDLQLRGFKAYQVDTKVDPMPHYGRRDFYKVCLIKGRSLQTMQIVVLT